MNIEDRLAKLERESKSWRRIALGLALVFGVSLSCSQGTQAPPASRAFAARDESFDTIRAHTLEIVDASGEVVAALKGQATGASLRLSSTDDSHSEVYLSSTDGGVCSVLGTDNLVGMSSDRISLLRRDVITDRELEQYTAKQKRGEKLDESEKNSLSELLRRPDLPLCDISVNEAGGATIAVYNPLGKNVVTMQSNKTNSGSVIVYDVNGKPSKSLSTD